MPLVDLTQLASISSQSIILSEAVPASLLSGCRRQQLLTQHKESLWAAHIKQVYAHGCVVYTNLSGFGFLDLL